MLIGDQLVLGSLAGVQVVDGATIGSHCNRPTQVAVAVPVIEIGAISGV